MATTKKTKSVDFSDYVPHPEPTAAPPGLLARQKDVDWLNGRETCGFYSNKSDGDDLPWIPYTCFVGTCTIRSTLLGCNYGFYTGCEDTFGEKCPSSRARRRKRQDSESVKESFLCCTGAGRYCMTGIMTLGEDEFLTAYTCRTNTRGEVSLYPSTLDAAEPSDTDTNEGTTTKTPDVISDPNSPPTTSVDPETRTGGSSVNVGAIAGGVIGGVGVLVIVICCVFYFRRRRREENDGRVIKPKPVFAGTDYPQPPHVNTYEKPDDQLPRVATEMPPFSTLGSNTAAELPGKQ